MLGLIALPLLAAALAVPAEDTFVCVPLADLKFEGEAPSDLEHIGWMLGGWGADATSTQIRFDPIAGRTAPEAYLLGGEHDGVADAARLAMRMHDDGEWKGVLILPHPAQVDAAPYRFTLGKPASCAHAERDFDLARMRWCNSLANIGAPGAAWFRHQARELEKQLALPEADAAARAQAPDRQAERDAELERTFQMFTGARALAENLQLDRVPRVTNGSDEAVPIESVEGITTKAFDFEALLKDKQPELDPLAECIPADQHAIFVPSFQAMLDLFDEMKKTASPLLLLTADQEVDPQVMARYQRQLCLPVNDVSRMLGPAVVAEIALTGSDPYLASGTDVGVLFRAKDDAAAAAFIANWKQTADAACGVESADDAAPGCLVAQTPDRSISAFLLARGQRILVANSRVQVRAFAETVDGKRPSLASAPEYRFFRDRYARGGDEAALAVLPDAAIRRWCSPRWRIADSRRTRVLAEQLDQRMHALCAEDAALPKADPPAFLMPIAEMDVPTVTKAEADAYARFRADYQSNFGAFFDPIAVRIGRAGNALSADLTVIPLIAGTDFEDILEVTKGATLKAGAGYPHAEAMVHFAFAFDTKAARFHEAEDFVSGMLGRGEVDPLAWMDGGIGVFLDAGPFWEEWAREDHSERYAFDHLSQVPVGICIDVKNPLAAAVFITALRAFGEQTVPGSFAFATVKRGEQSYVKVTDSSGLLDGDGHAQLCYALLGKRLILSPCDAVLERYLDRLASKEVDATPWLGTSAGLRVDSRALDLLKSEFAEEYAAAVRARSFAALPILDEWHRRFPDRDPLDVHARIFGAAPVEPAGGTYRWNAEAAAMESSTFGRPGAETKDAKVASLLDDLKRFEAGIGFEHGGLRASFTLDR